MAKAFPLDLVSADGCVIQAVAHVSTTPTPGSVLRDFAVRLEWPGGSATGTGCDAFDALRAARQGLPAGLLPRCYGVCRNFVMSGMASQMGGGGAGYLVSLGRQATGTDLVMTFDAGPDMDLASVAEQDAFKASWLESLGHKGTPNQALQQTPPHDSFLGWLSSLVRRGC